MVRSIFLFLSLSKTLFLFKAFASPSSQPQTPPPNLSIIQPTNLTSVSYDNLHCIDLLNPFSSRPKYSDCTLAIRQLPNIPAMGIFHNRGSDDLFKLPVEKVVSSCAVRVELRAATSTVATSWAGISVRATALNRLCLRTIFPTYKGGWATYAKNDRIVISLQRPDRYSDDEDISSAGRYEFF